MNQLPNSDLTLAAILASVTALEGVSCRVTNKKFSLNVKGSLNVKLTLC
jgi:hypothetical protein